MIPMDFCLLRAVARGWALFTALIFAQPAFAWDCAELLLRLNPPKDFSEWLVQPRTRPPVAQIIPSKLPILVIGAGVAGLSAMQALQAQGLAFEAVERSARVGGVWDSQNEQSPAYDHLGTNSSKVTTELPGEPMPPNWKPYISRDQAWSYLAGFAEKHGLTSQIQFETEVTRAVKNADGTWSVTFREVQTGAVETKQYRGLVIAAGVHNKDNRAYPRELWESAVKMGMEVMHASDYRSPETLRGKRVLIIGAGNSAADIATAVSAVAARTVVSVRSDPWFVPRFVLGKAADAFAVEGPKLPHWLEAPIFRFLQWWYVGNQKKLGFDKPDHKLLDKLPITDPGFTKAIREGKIEIRSNIDSFKYGMAHYEDLADPSDPIDVVIFATGYKRRFSFLDASLTPFDDPLFEMPMHVFHPTDPTLTIMTEVMVPQGVWPMFAKQAEAIAAYYAAVELGLPNVAAFNQMRTSAVNPDFKGYLFSAADQYHVDPAIYAAVLESFSKWILESR